MSRGKENTEKLDTWISKDMKAAIKKHITKAGLDNYAQSTRSLLKKALIAEGLLTEKSEKL